MISPKRLVTVLAAVLLAAAASVLYLELSARPAPRSPRLLHPASKRKIEPPSKEPTAALPTPAPTPMSAIYEFPIRTAAPAPSTPETATASETPALVEPHLTPSAATDDVQGPELLYGPEPLYPEAARKGRIEGTVVIEATLTERGEIENPVVLRSLNPLLDRAALEAVRKWRYKPATSRGKPIRVFVTINSTFSLR